MTSSLYAHFSSDAYNINIIQSIWKFDIFSMLKVAKVFQVIPLRGSDDANDPSGQTFKEPVN